MVETEKVVKSSDAAISFSGFALAFSGENGFASVVPFSSHFS